MRQDLVYALRMFARHPSVAGIAVLTLAVGIAASTVVFTLADAILWHPLPFKDPERIVSLMAAYSSDARPQRQVPAAALIAWTAKDAVLDHVYAYSLRSAVVTLSEPQSVTVGELSPGLITSLGARPALGRDFVADDAASGREPVAIVGDGLGRTLGVEENGPARTIAIDGTVHTIVGVMPPGFAFPVGRVALWVPLSEAAARPARLIAMARLRPEISLAEAQNVAEGTTRDLVDEQGRRLPGLRVMPFVTPSAATRGAFHVLLGAVGVLFLIALGNASNVLLAQAVRRDAEMALRTSLGATRGRLARQVLFESLLLSGGAALLAAGIAAWVISKTAGAVPYLMSFQSLRPLELSWRGLLFSGLTSALAGLVAALASIVRGTRRDLHSTLRGLTAPTASHSRWRAGFIVAQLALTLVLLTSAGLLANGFVRMARADRGFDPAHVMQLSIGLPEHSFPDPRATDRKLEELRREAASLPEVTSATIAESIPPELGFTGVASLETSDGAPLGRADDLIALADVDDGFFRTLAIPILFGRAFDPRDGREGEATAVISGALASRLWPAADAVGRHFRLEGTEPWLTVIGIAGDVANGAFDAPRGTLAVYRARAQQRKAWRYQTLIVRTRVDSPRTLASLRSQVRKTLPDAPIDSTESAYETIAQSNARVRFATGLMAAFAAVALGLALVGVYGSFWCAVRQRTGEIGVRLALGASSRAILTMVLSSSARLVSLGVALGAPVALAAAGALRSLLFEVSPHDPLTFGLVVAVLAFAALAATYLPARAASRIDPLEALRHP